jgi:hypothetical protein
MVFGLKARSVLTPETAVCDQNDCRDFQKMSGLTSVILLLLVIVAQFTLTLSSHSSLGLQHLLGLALSSAWETLTRIEVLETRRARPSSF